MDFLKKAQARANALETLGLAGHPDMCEVKAEFKRLAFEKHPDRGNSTSGEFAKVYAAYKLLKEDEGFTVANQLQRVPGKASIQKCPVRPKRPGNARVADILRGERITKLGLNFGDKLCQ